eukprot:TRINITY_DN5721_c1_g2_i1.p1 TRINITY_DN5721_c1_g2~~TRINITY_DN5721_c1_g2_i1.p1  ORF type:complete len:1049 (+),score=260.89 TRINITY_DN5721_c1_g2_i1:460-3147(+)
MDRLVTDLHLSPQEAFVHLKKILEQVNVITGSLFHQEVLRAADESDAKAAAAASGITVDAPAATAATAATDAQAVPVADDEASVYFSPEKGNVIFGSAVDGWAFRLQDFVELYASRLKMRKDVLFKTLWGDFYFDVKGKRVCTKPPTADSMPMFASFVLKPIFDVYNAALVYPDQARLDKILITLKHLNIPPKELTKPDKREVLEAIMSRWWPIANCVLDCAVELLPSPAQAQQRKVVPLWDAADLPKQSLDVIEAIRQGSRDENAPVVGFISKVFPVKKEFLPGGRFKATDPTRRRKEAATAEEDPLPALPETESGDVYIALARLYSGTLRRGQQVYVLAPRYDPTQPSQFQFSASIQRLFMPMGQYLEDLDQVYAGNIFGIGGFTTAAIFKTATFTSTLACPSFPPLWNTTSQPIVRVAIEPKVAADRPLLVAALRQLSQADPVFQTLVQQSGDIVLLSAGELHLARCLRDLQDIMGRREMIVSAPIVPFREAVLPPTEDKTVEDTTTANKKGLLRVRAVPLPKEVTALLENSSALVAACCKKTDASEEAKQFREKLLRSFSEAGPTWEDRSHKIWSFGPHGVGPNVLFNCVPNYKDWDPLLHDGDATPMAPAPADVTPPAVAADVTPPSDDATQGNCANCAVAVASSATTESVEFGMTKEAFIELARPSESDSREVTLRALESSIISGFQMAVSFGPLCGEPLQGVAFIVEEIQLLRTTACDYLGPMSGQFVAAMKDACSNALQECSLRLMEPLYRCEIRVPMEALGKVYGVLHRRRGKVFSEMCFDSTSVFTVEAWLPVAESFGFADEIRTKTSGAAAPQLVFEKYEMMEQDPNWVPTTEEEIQEFGESGSGQAPNIPRKYIDQTRKRKGLPVMEKLVESAEKQRTLSRKK